jgi:hypothetical protein
MRELNSELSLEYDGNHKVEIKITARILASLVKWATSSEASMQIPLNMK